MSVMSWLRAHPTLKRFLKFAIVIGILYGGWWSWVYWRVHRELNGFEAELNRLAFPPGYEQVETLRSGCFSLILWCDQASSVSRAFRVAGPPPTGGTLIQSILRVLERREWLVREADFVDCFVEARRGKYDLVIDASQYVPSDFRAYQDEIQCPRPAWSEVYLRARVSS